VKRQAPGSNDRLFFEPEVSVRRTQALTSQSGSSSDQLATRLARHTAATAATKQATSVKSFVPLNLFPVTDTVYPQDSVFFTELWESTRFVRSSFSCHFLSLRSRKFQPVNSLGSIILQGIKTHLLVSRRGERPTNDWQYITTSPLSGIDRRTPRKEQLKDLSVENWKGQTVRRMEFPVFSHRKRGCKKSSKTVTATLIRAQSKSLTTPILWHFARD
jgi:hypothetical protein